MSHDDHYIDDIGPGRGQRRLARSWLHTDAPTLSLAGDWQFRLLAGVPGRIGAPDVLPAGEAEESFAEPTYDDSDWDTLPVPSHWVLNQDGRYGGPQYTNVHLPIPQEPPFSPDLNPTGDHRVSFEVPTAWTDRDTFGAVVLRFDGVESRYRVWINGTEIGVGSGSRLAQEFDVTDALVAGENVIAVRVHQWSASTYVEDQDQWWLPGIFRDVTLQARPVGGLDDVWIRAGYDHHTAEGVITPELRVDATAFPVRLAVPDLGIDVVWGEASEVRPVEVRSVEPWSAEEPRLYDCTVTSRGDRETVSLRLGFRSIEIEGDRFLVNGRRVVLHGMNRHDTNPDLGRGFDEDFVRRDLALMKQHNVNAIRTAHYPPHPRVLDLADELGFWVMLECDIETHSFHHGGSVFTSGTDEWMGNPSEDPVWRETYLDRIERTVERDKNHPSIVMWSLGNESGTGANLAAMSHWVHDRDPERPVHYEGDHAGDYTDVYSRMYPSIAEVTSIGTDSTALLLNASGAQSARQRGKPFLMCEYVHAMGNGPGGIDRYEGLVDQYPRLHGGFVWEWRDHGLRTTTADGVEYYGYGGDFGETGESDGAFCMDGMVLSDGTPSPGLAEFKAVTAPIRMSFRPGNGRVVVTVENLRHSADTSDLEFPWRLERDGIGIASGVLDVTGRDGGALLAGESTTTVILSNPEVVGDSTETTETWLTVSAVLSADTAWATAGHVIAIAQIPTSEAKKTPPETMPATGWRASGEDQLDSMEPFSLGLADFAHGRLTQLSGMPIGGPRLELWRAPTDNDRGSHMGSYDASDPMEGRGLGIPGVSHAEAWLDAGLDRMQPRILELMRTATSFRRRTRWAAPDSREAVVLEERWGVSDDAVTLDIDIVPTSRWTIVVPRVGVRFDLPARVDEADWFGAGPGETYPDSRRAAVVGTYRSRVDDMTFPYARPQESGHRSDLRRLTLSAGGTEWLQIDASPERDGRRPGFSLARHTPQEIDRAAHQYELAPSDATYLHLDLAQNGLGSRACGPDVWPDALARLEARSLRLRLTSASGRNAS